MQDSVWFGIILAIIMIAIIIAPNYLFDPLKAKRKKLKRDKKLLKFLKQELKKSKEKLVE